MSPIELVCFDMAGTTMIDGGLVLEAFRRTISGMGVIGDAAATAESYVVETMGQSKIEVFTELFGEDGPRANASFEGHFIDAAQELGVSEIPGARATIEALRILGFKVALTTGFSRDTREALIDVLGWSDLFDLRVSPSDAGRGRPAPDMLWWCALALRASDIRSLMAVGDTASDMQAGRRAGTGSCVGVLSGTDGERRLRDAGADEVVDSVVDLLGFSSLAGR